MNDPSETPVVNVQAKQEFLVQQAELRQARARWVDEHERPVPMVVLDDQGKPAYPATFKGKDGTERATPFLIGCQTYSDELPHRADPDSATGYRRPAISFLPEQATEEQAQVSAQMGEVTRQYNQFSGITTRDERGMDISLSHKSDHPPIRKGETHEEWFHRVRKTYRDAPQDRADAGIAGSDPDGLRQPRAGIDPGDGRPASAAGAEGGGDHPEAHVHREPVADRAGRPRPDPGRIALGVAECPDRRASFGYRASAALTRCLRALFRKRKSSERSDLPHLQRQRQGALDDAEREAIEKIVRRSK